MRGKQRFSMTMIIYTYAIIDHKKGDVRIMPDDVIGTDDTGDVWRYLLTRDEHI